MFERVSRGIKIVAIVNTIINFLLLIPLFLVVKTFLSRFFVLGLAIIIANILLGIVIILLKNWARRCFIIIQIPNLIISVYPFMVFLQLGLGGAGNFGDAYEPWSDISTLQFWKELASFILGMSFPTVPMLCSIFYIFYLMLPKVKEQFK